MGRLLPGLSETIVLEDTDTTFPMIPPQVNGATKLHPDWECVDVEEFPMIPPQVNGATGYGRYLSGSCSQGQVSNDSAPS